MHLRTFCCSLLGVIATTVAAAAPITLIHESQASGTFNGLPFSFTNVRFTAIGDTSNIEQDGSLRWMWHAAPARIDIDGIGSFELLLTTRTFHAFAAIDQGIVGLEASTFPIMAGPRSPLLRNWNMQSSIGPVFGFADWNAVPLETTGGTFVPNEGIDFPASFRAILPEPSSLLLLVGALGFASAQARRRG